MDENDRLTRKQMTQPLPEGNRSPEGFHEYLERLERERDAYEAGESDAQEMIKIDPPEGEQRDKDERDAEAERQAWLEMERQEWEREALERDERERSKLEREELEREAEEPRQGGARVRAEDDPNAKREFDPDP